MKSDSGATDTLQRLTVYASPLEIFSLMNQGAVNIFGRIKMQQRSRPMRKAEKEKRCGNCKHWNELKGEQGYGECLWQLPDIPDSFSGDGYKADRMWIEEGTHCSCYEVKHHA